MTSVKRVSKSLAQRSSSANPTVIDLLDLHICEMFAVRRVPHGLCQPKSKLTLALVPDSLKKLHGSSSRRHDAGTFTVDGVSCSL